MEEVIVTIKKGGAVSIEVEGASGPACQELTKGLEEKLGEVSQVTEKPEFYESGQDVHNRNKAGR